MQSVKYRLVAEPVDGGGKSIEHVLMLTPGQLDHVGQQMRHADQYTPDAAVVSGDLDGADVVDDDA